MTICIDRPVYKFGDAKRKQSLSKVKVKVQPGSHVAHLNVHAQETEGVPVLLSVNSVMALGAVIIFETGHAIFRNPEPENMVQPERSPTGHMWMDLFEQMPVVSDNPLSLLGHVKSGANVGLMLRNSEAHVLIVHNNSCTDSQRTSLSGQTHETGIPDTTTMRSRGNSADAVPLESPFNLKKSGTIISEDGIRENRSHVARRSDGTAGTAGMGTSCERGVHASRKEEHLARTRGEGDEVRDERQSERMRRLEQKEQDRAERSVARRSAFLCRVTRRNHS